MTRENSNEARMPMTREYIIHMLKNGKQDEIRKMVLQQRENYPDQFVPFMDQMIHEHKKSRKDVAVLSGLSQDYVYKLLRGDKRTDERDYILAMCFAIGMNFPQTQHALSCYGMPQLSQKDPRSNIIIICINEHRDIENLNAMLENVGFPLLRTNPDMPKARITNTDPVEKNIQENATIPFAGDRREFKEIDSFVDGQHNGGNAPFDYDYQGWLKLKDEEGHIYQVEAIFKEDYSSFTVFTEEQRKEAERLMLKRHQLEKAFYEKHRDIMEAEGDNFDLEMHPDLYAEYMSIDNEVPEAVMQEHYESLVDASASEFFPYFLELDKRTDKKVQEVLLKLDDTREFGMRFGASWHSQPQIYIESFNNANPELREYFQIVEYRDGSCRYTATHDSCYMQIELGKELYDAIFGLKREPEFFIASDKNEFSGSQLRYRFYFNHLKATLDELALDHFPGMVELDPAVVADEKIEVLIEDGVNHAQGDQPEKAVTFFKGAIATMESLGAPTKSHLADYICTCYKLAQLLGTMNSPEADGWWDRILELKEAVKEVAAANNGNEYKGALTCIVDALINHFARAQYMKDKTHAKLFIKEAIQMIEQNNAGEEEWDLQFEAYSNRAFLTEEDDKDSSMRDYRKALEIARNHHLDQIPKCARAVAVQYNNYAWVLWNWEGSEEAIIYYGRAIDLLESYLFSGIIDHDTVLHELDHVGSALYNIYLATSREREAERLKERLRENGVEIKKSKN